MTTGSRAAAIQGWFPAGQPRLPGHCGAVQPQGHATELPTSALDLSRRTGGKPLPSEVRTKMETAFDADFSDVRIYEGSEAGSIGALAFTYGSDIYFAPGLYSPSTIHGQRLLGHELTHVLQQRAGRVRNPYGAGVAVVQDPGLEAEADRLGMRAAAQPMVQQKPRHATDAEGSLAAAPQVRAALPKKPAATAVPKPAAHVQAAIGVQPKADPLRLAGRDAADHVRSAVQPKGAPGAASGYRLVIGAYLHRDAGNLPEELAGHAFVSIQEPGGHKETWGFSPQDRSYDPNRDLGRLRAGVQGKLHADDRAFAKPGVKVKSYDISRDQARAARAKVAEFRTQNPAFSLGQRQCSSFALDVARAAKVDAVTGPTVQKPRDLYQKL